MTATLPSAAV